jgi:hypothetical protein
MVLLVLLSPGLLLTTSAGQPVDAPFPVRDEVETEVQPAIAFNSQWRNYLVVLWNDRPGCDDIRAERLSGRGRPLGGKWVAAGCPAERRYPDVAYNRKHNEYLVVWVEESGGINYIRSQRLSAEAELLGPSQIIVQDASPLLHPAVDYAFTSDKYLVVWTDEFATGSSIIGKVVSSDGQPQASYLEISKDPVGEPRQQPDLAYNRHANGYLVVWQQWDAGNSIWDVRGRLVSGNGDMPLGQIYVGNWNVDITAPAVAAIPTTSSAYKYLVVWEKATSPSDRDIYGRFIQEDGTPAPTGFNVSIALVDQSQPAVAGDEAGQRFLVTWRHPAGLLDVSIRGQAISPAGSLQYQEAIFGGPAAGHPALASGAGGTFLVTWQDRSVFATHTDIWGQFWGNWVHLPLVVR